METAFLTVAGIAMALLILGVCVAAREREQETRTLGKRDAYRSRPDLTPRPAASRR
jgi:hypothetical protein